MSQNRTKDRNRSWHSREAGETVRESGWSGRAPWRGGACGEGGCGHALPADAPRPPSPPLLSLLFSSRLLSLSLHQACTHLKTQQQQHEQRQQFNLVSGLLPHALFSETSIRFECPAHVRVPSHRASEAGCSLYSTLKIATEPLQTTTLRHHLSFSNQQKLKSLQCASYPCD